MLKNKNVILTGCAKGIGKSILRTFAQQGAHIWACVRKPTDEFTQTVETLSRQFPVTITPVYFDLSIEDQVKEGMKSILASRQRIDILVNNAGMAGDKASFPMTSMKMIRDVFEVNFFAPLLITQYAVRAMIKQKNGVIVNISSIAGIDGDPAQMEYVASKAALIGATRKLSRELAVHNIRVNAVAPGLTETDMLGGMNEAVRAGSLIKCAMQRVAKPDEIAQAVLFLASDMSSYITGQVLRVDGGI